MMNALFMLRSHWLTSLVILTICVMMVFLFVLTYSYKFKKRILSLSVIPPVDLKNISLAQTSSLTDSSQWMDPVTAHYILLGAWLWGLVFFSCVAVLEVPRCYAHYTGHKIPLFSRFPDGTLCSSAKPKFEGSSLEKGSSNISYPNTSIASPSSYSVTDETSLPSKSSVELKMKVSTIEVSTEEQNVTPSINDSSGQVFPPDQFQFNLPTNSGSSINVDVEESLSRLMNYSSNNSVSSFGGQSVEFSNSSRTPSLEGLPSETNIADNIEAIYNSPISDIFSEIPVGSSTSINSTHLYETITEIWSTNFFAMPENFVGLAEFLNQMFQIL